MPLTNIALSLACRSLIALTSIIGEKNQGHRWLIVACHIKLLRRLEDYQPAWGKWNYPAALCRLSLVDLLSSWRTSDERKSKTILINCRLSLKSECYWPTLLCRLSLSSSCRPDERKGETINWPPLLFVACRCRAPVASLESTGRAKSRNEDWPPPLLCRLSLSSSCRDEARGEKKRTPTTAFCRLSMGSSCLWITLGARIAIDRISSVYKSHLWRKLFKFHLVT